MQVWSSPGCWECHLPPQGPCLGVPRLFSGLTYSENSGPHTSRGRGSLAPSGSPTLTTGVAVTALLAQLGNHGTEAGSWGLFRGVWSPQARENRKPEPTCGQGRAVPSCLPVAAPARGGVSSPSLERLPLLAPPFAWKLLHPNHWGTQHPQGPPVHSCSLPPIPCPSWREGHACPLAWILFQGAPDPGEGSAFSCPDESSDFDVLRTRHARHARKRRRLV